MRKLAELPREEQEELVNKVQEINDWVNERLGGHHDVLLLIHEAHDHHQKCHGVAMVTPIENPKISLSMLDQAFGSIITMMEREAPPPGTTLN